MTQKFGVSFSLHRCSELGLDKSAVLNAAIKELGLRRFRLMSYWNIHEQKKGVYDFTELDWQLDLIAKHGGSVTMCVGKRQPRWPECHMPEWALGLCQYEWYEALYSYIEAVVNRYKSHPALISWQLENEALLKGFGNCEDGDYSSKRLKREYDIVKSLDPKHPIIMSLSDSWGIPFKAPEPDQYAMSLYRITINKRGKYSFSQRPVYFYRLRAFIISVFKQRPLFIHELQAEPWLNDSILSTPVKKQLKYMNPKLFREIISFADSTRLYPIDLWGLEWWYWLRTNGDPSLWDNVRQQIDSRTK